MKTLNEISTIVAKCINEIRYYENGKSKPVSNDSISKACIKYKIRESHIRKVGGWENLSI